MTGKDERDLADAARRIAAAMEATVRGMAELRAASERAARATEALGAKLDRIHERLGGLLRDRREG